MPPEKYVNVKRLLTFLERSIDAGTQWVVFELTWKSPSSRIQPSFLNEYIFIHCFAQCPCQAKRACFACTWPRQSASRRQTSPQNCDDS